MTTLAPTASSTPALRRLPWLLSFAAALAPPAMAAPAFNAVLFEESVHAKMKGQVKAYAFVVADKDGIQARAAGGWAQDPADGNLAMSTTIPSGIGSVTKTLSGVALLNLLEAQPEVRLDTPIWNKLPKKWQQKYAGTQVECVTYRQLLQHRSGFLLGEDNDDPGVENFEAAGKKSCPFKATRKYNNFNIYLLRYLIPALAYPQDVAAIESKHAQRSFDDYSKQVNIEYSHLYERYVKATVLARGLVPIAASCRPEAELMPKVAKGYADRTDTNGGLINTTAKLKDTGNYCASQGSWYTSAEMLAQFGRTLLFSDRYLTPATRGMLFDPKQADERIVWSSTVQHAGFGAETGQSAWPYHGGAQGGYRAALVQLPHGHVGAALINSGEHSSTQLASALIGAFHDATRGVPVALAKHGLTPAQYQHYASEMDANGHTIDWVDFYNVGERVFVNAVFRPATEGKAYARHNLSGAQYQQEYEQKVKNGPFRLVLVDSYLDGGEPRYAFLMRRGANDGAPAYHGANAADHKRLFDEHTAKGFVPTSVSVVSHGGERRFSTSWQRRNTKGLVVRSTLDAAEYEALTDDLTGKGMELAYLNVYAHAGQLQYSAVFVGDIDRPQVLRHGMDPARYQHEFDDWGGKGFGLKLVAGAGVGTQHRFAAVWQR